MGNGRACVGIQRGKPPSNCPGIIFEYRRHFIRRAAVHNRIVYEKEVTSANQIFNNAINRLAHDPVVDEPGLGIRMINRRASVFLNFGGTTRIIEDSHFSDFAFKNLILRESSAFAILLLAKHQSAVRFQIPDIDGGFKSGVAIDIHFQLIRRLIPRKRYLMLLTIE